MMNKYDTFFSEIKKATDYFKSLNIKGTVRIVSHLDCDGISAASILIRALENENLPYSVSIVQQLSAEYIDELSEEDYDIFFFTDLGSGATAYLTEKMPNKKIFILDHHEITDKTEYKNITHINPHLSGITGNKDISGAGVVFFFCKSLNEKNKQMAHIAIIGAIGDIQENQGFSKLNSMILEIAKDEGIIEVKKNLRSFGKTKFLHKMLEYSSDPYIPGVTGSESGAIQFLSNAGINPKNEKNGFKRYIDLTDEEEKRLYSAIIMRRLSEDNPEDIFGFSYLLPHEDFDNLNEAKEFSTLLNASGRLKNASLGIGVCLGDERMKRKAIANLVNYKKQIVTALNWYDENKDNPDFILSKNGFILINAKENILSTIAGTLASIISKSNNCKKGTLILSMARSEDGVKTSLRIVGETNLDLRDIMQEIVDVVGGETGGHKNAAGAMIPKDKEDEFIKVAKKILDEKSSN